MHTENDLPRFCPMCGHKYEDGAMYCVKCAHPRMGRPADDHPGEGAAADDLEGSTGGSVRKQGGGFRAGIPVIFGAVVLLTAAVVGGLFALGVLGNRGDTPPEPPEKHEATGIDIHGTRGSVDTDINKIMDASLMPIVEHGNYVYMNGNHEGNKWSNPLSLVRLNRDNPQDAVVIEMPSAISESANDAIDDSYSSESWINQFEVIGDQMVVVVHSQKGGSSRDEIWTYPVDDASKAESIWSCTYSDPDDDLNQDWNMQVVGNSLYVYARGDILRAEMDPSGHWVKELGSETVCSIERTGDCWCVYDGSVWQFERGDAERNVPCKMQRYLMDTTASESVIDASVSETMMVSDEPISICVPYDGYLYCLKDEDDDMCHTLMRYNLNTQSMEEVYSDSLEANIDDFSVCQDGIYVTLVPYKGYGSSTLESKDATYQAKAVLLTHDGKRSTELYTWDFAAHDRLPNGDGGGMDISAKSLSEDLEGCEIICKLSLTSSGIVLRPGFSVAGDEWRRGASSVGDAYMQTWDMGYGDGSRGIDSSYPYRDVTMDWLSARIFINSSGAAEASVSVTKQYAQPDEDAWGDIDPSQYPEDLRSIIMGRMESHKDA